MYFFSNAIVFVLLLSIADDENENEEVTYKTKTGKVNGTWTSLVIYLFFKS